MLKRGTKVKIKVGKYKGKIAQVMTSIYGGGTKMYILDIDAEDYYKKEHFTIIEE